MKRVVLHLAFFDMIRFDEYLLPWHGHVLQQLVDSMGYKLEGAQVDPLVMPELSGRHVAMILADEQDKYKFLGARFFVYFLQPL